MAKSSASGVFDLFPFWQHQIDACAWFDYSQKRGKLV